MPNIHENVIMVFFLTLYSRLIIPSVMQKTPEYIFCNIDKYLYYVYSIIVKEKNTFFYRVF